MSTSHFMMELKVVSWMPQDSMPRKEGWKSASGLQLHHHGRAGDRAGHQGEAVLRRPGLRAGDGYCCVVLLLGESSELDLQGIRIDPDISGTLKFACESIVEEYEDELIEFFSREADNVKDKLCSKRTDLCDHALHISHDEL